MVSTGGQNLFELKYLKRNTFYPSGQNHHHNWSTFPVPGLIYPLHYLQPCSIKYIVLLANIHLHVHFLGSIDGMMHFQAVHCVCIKIHINLSQSPLVLGCLLLDVLINWAE